MQQGSRTFAMIKPGFENVIGPILTIIIENGFSIELMIQRHLTLDQTKALYAQHANASFFEPLCKYIASGPVFLIRLFCPPEEYAWTRWRTLMNVIRARYGINFRRNVVHGSDSAESADVELQWMQELI